MDTDKSKLTLLVDGNWLLMSRLSVLNDKYVDDFELCHDLQLLMIKSINVVLRNFRQIDNVIFCSDGGSWRNNIPIPSYLHTEDGKPIEYKGTRTKSPDINWTAIFSAYDEFIQILSDNGITVSKEKEVEGDDWIWWWSTYLNSQGTNCIIWSKDNDLKQLANMSSCKCFTVIWDKDNGLYAKDLPDDSFDFMVNYEFTQNETLLSDICDHSVKVTKIDPSQIVLDKILKGDISDNIQPTILRVSKTDRKFKVSAKDIPYGIDVNNDQAVSEYIHNLLSSKKYNGKTCNTVDETIDHFKYNRKLVELSQCNYPKHIYEKISSHKEYNKSKDLSIVESKVQAMSNKLNGLLEII